jgi:hypothetical protein
MKRGIPQQPADALATRRIEDPPTIQSGGLLPAEAEPDDQLAPVMGTRILGLLSGQERKLDGVVPREMTLRARLGYVELDLSNARFQPGVTTIDVDAILGYVQIRFPRGVRVESNGHAVIGYFAFKVGGAPQAAEASDAQPVVQVTGGAFLGFAEGLTTP